MQDPMTQTLTENLEDTMLFFGYTIHIPHKLGLKTIHHLNDLTTGYVYEVDRETYEYLLENPEAFFDTVQDKQIINLPEEDKGE